MKNEEIKHFKNMNQMLGFICVMSWCILCMLIGFAIFFAQGWKNIGYIILISILSIILTIVYIHQSKKNKDHD